MKKYRIISRYEWYSSSGITWTKWFQIAFSPIADTEEELKDELKKCKDNYKPIEKATKRKQEFKIEKFDYQPIKIEPITTKKRGRKKKEK